MSTSPAPVLSVEEYLELERLAEVKHEYVDGAMIAMAGGSPAHSLITANIIGVLGTRLLGKACKVFSSDLRVCIRWGKLITYPDVTVACPPLEYVDSRNDTISNPRIVIEVLSPSTRNFDIGEKVRMFRMAPSIQEYLLIEQAPVEIEHGHRLPSGRWEVAIAQEMDEAIRLESIGCEIRASEIYKGLEIL